MQMPKFKDYLLLVVNVRINGGGGHISPLFRRRMELIVIKKILFTKIKIGVFGKSHLPAGVQNFSSGRD